MSRFESSAVRGDAHPPNGGLWGNKGDTATKPELALRDPRRCATTAVCGDSEAL